jgi:hypothetical protein
MSTDGLIGVVMSKNNSSIRLTKERWAHITNAHPELEILDPLRVLGIVEYPDIVFKGDTDELLAVKKISRKKMWFVVVYKEVSNKDGFILTAYVTTDERWLLKKKEIWNKMS